MTQAKTFRLPPGHVQSPKAQQNNAVVKMQTPLDRPRTPVWPDLSSSPRGEGKCCRGFIKSNDDNNDTLTTPSRPWARYLGPSQDSVRMMRRDKKLLYI